MKKIGLISIVLVVAMGMLGVGYAMWDKTLTIDGTVNTGEVNAALSAGDSWDTEPPEKDVSSIECHLDPLDDQILIVTVTNAYPCIDYYQLFDVHNTGTIPVKVQDHIMDLAAMPADATVEIIDGVAIGDQLEPDDMVWGTIHVHLGNDAEENMGGIGGPAYTFTVEIYLVQWNEFTP